MTFSDKEKNTPTDNENRDRTFKVRPITEHFNKSFQSEVGPEECKPINEHIIKFRVHNILHQYVKNKPIR